MCRIDGGIVVDGGHWCVGRGRKNMSRWASTRDLSRRGTLTPPSVPFAITTFAAKLDVFERQEAFARNTSCARPPHRCISFAIALLYKFVQDPVDNCLLWGSFFCRFAFVCRQIMPLPAHSRLFANFLTEKHSRLAELEVKLAPMESVPPPPPTNPFNHAFERNYTAL